MNKLYKFLKEEYIPESMGVTFLVGLAIASFGILFGMPAGQLGAVTNIQLCFVILGTPTAISSLVGIGMLFGAIKRRHIS